MLRHTRPMRLIVFAFAIISVYLVCHAQPPEIAKTGTEGSSLLLKAGPVEPLRNMVGRVEVWLQRSSTEPDRKVRGDLIGLDPNWVVVRVDHMNDEPKRSDFQWIPVANIERMIQHTVHPERLAPLSSQQTK